jgi:hypothetical protein
MWETTLFLISSRLNCPLILVNDFTETYKYKKLPFNPHKLFLLKMCGLISAFYPDGVDAPAVDDLKRGLEASLETIKYRGPDSRGIYISPDARVGTSVNILHYAYIS